MLGVLGSMQAMEAIKLMIDRPHLTNGEILFTDLLGLNFDIRRFPKVKDCPCCVKHEFDQKLDRQIALPRELHQFILLDVRSHLESESCPFIKGIKDRQNILYIPMDKIPEFRPLPGQKYLAVCASGKRSLQACKILNKYNSEVYSLAGGIEALSLEEKYE